MVGITLATAANARYAVNNAMYTIDQKVIPFVAARFSRNQNLVLTTAPYHNSLEYKAYLGVITNILKPLGKDVARLNKKWTKYVAHNLPANMDPATAKIEFEKIYPSLTLAQAPRWLTTPR
jgi:hypothetical protein